MDELIDPLDEHAEPGPPEVEAPPVASGTGVVRYVVDCATGEQKAIELSEAEAVEVQAKQADQAARRASLEQDRAAAAVAREADVELVRERAKTDADFAALARLAGIEIPEVMT
jgi:hypothetical protein